MSLVERALQVARDERAAASAAAGAVAAGGVLHLVHQPGAADVLWGAVTAALLVPLSWSVLRTLLRRDVGVDAVALFSMAGSLALGEYLVGAIVALMLSGGNALEAYAGRRARRELTALVARAPRVAHRRVGDELEEVPVEAVLPGDTLVVRAGEVVPVDGAVASDEAILDESALTGEPLPVTVHRGGLARSGTANAGEAFELRATKAAADSSYSALVRLVREAETQRAPFVRVADRYAAIFLPFTMVVAGIAWGVSGDPLRALAVFVVATPCPLILAAPIALISGVSRAARAGVIVKGGGVIEQLGSARSVLLDKTGTLTLGHPEVENVVALDGMAPDELLRLAASLDQVSAHALAEALVVSARQRGLALSFPEHPEERLGQGVEGIVEGRRVAVGSAAWLGERGIDGAVATGLADRLDAEHGAGRAKILLAVDGRLAGAIVMADRPRADAAGLADRLRAAGVRHIAMVTGDRLSSAEEVGRELGVDRIYAEQSPEQKLEVVKALQAQPELRSVVMVGDGINDAPALAVADVGIAMGTAGATVSSETANAVIVVDRVDRIVDAIVIGRRSLFIARQSVIVGMGLSMIAMVFAAVGLLDPLEGALLQEAIDVAVILNALRALRA
jgi:heavy metal translocating P-type ATPase